MDQSILDDLVVTIEPMDFRDLVTDFEKMVVGGVEVVDDVCTTINNFRSGVPVQTNLSIYHFKRMTFFNCLASVDGGEEFRIKSHYAHESFTDKECFIIYLTDEKNSWIKFNKGDETCLWNIVKDSDKMFPKCGAEFLKVKYKPHGPRKILRLLTIYDKYVKVYKECYMAAVEKANA